MESVDYKCKVKFFFNEMLILGFFEIVIVQFAIQRYCTFGYFRESCEIYYVQCLDSQ